MGDASGQADPVLTVVDTNVLVEYYVGFAMDLLGRHGPPASDGKARIRREIREYLEHKASRGEICITDTVFQETIQQIWRVLSGNEALRLDLSPDQVYHICSYCTNHFVRLSRKMRRCGDTGPLGEVRAMYKKALGDPQGALRREWMAKKKNRGGAMHPGSRDLAILAAAVGLARRSPVQLLTLDSDFIVFGRMIKDTFGVTVRSAWCLGRGPPGSPRPGRA